jgi:hypothetical protein
MYLHRHDEDGKLAVWLFDKATEQEWEAHFEHLKQLAAWPASRGKRAACVLISGAFDRPTTRQRVTLARLTEAPGYDPYVAFVMPNLAVRSVLTMMGWVQKAPRYEMSFFPGTAEGLTWLHEKRSDARPGLQAMVDAVLEEQRKASADR